MSLEGFPLERIFSVRKVKVFYWEGAVRRETYLQPETQLLEDQGKFLHQFVFGMVDKKRHLNLQAGHLQHSCSTW